MGTNMNLDFEAMRNVGGKIKGEQSELEALVRRMEGYVAELRSVWDSDAANEFENTWRQIEPGLRKLHEDVVPRIGEYIISSANTYEEADNVAKAGARTS